MASLSTIAVIGATGTAGSRVVARLKARDVAVVEISRRHGVDVVSGRGLFEALEGADVVIDVCNPLSERSDIMRTVATAARNVVAACAARDIRRLVVSTVANVEDPVFDGFPYYEAKREAKAIVLDSTVPATIVKSTQWYEFATNPVAVSSRDGEVVVEDWLIQPIAADTVADVLVEAALGQTHPPRTITGPQAVHLPELTSKLLAQQGDNRRVRAVPPGLGALGTGALLPSDGAVVVGPDVDTWLHTLAPGAADGVSADGDGAVASTRRLRDLSKT
ncbi:MULTISPECIES: SDR family oxidoreductase [unclassified Mycobacterium]|uniref:SDR family oxidoreductase n=1 Tax=unclassified Mycobacterium TaxID=2642494 RepID=UPI0007FF2C36|nr:MULTISPECIES: NAD(P)H-binding protein [unclassified Mycobacterium]OBH00368.1 NmrA family protein [Mycobacterium sp. E2699]OBI51193.1 NmrA family protein [Mycobacterium sp. E787]